MSPLHFIVPFGREGASDRAARAFARGLQQELSPPGSPRHDLVIENLPGCGGLTGVRRANELARAKAPVLLLGTPTTHILLPARLGRAQGPVDSFKPLLGLGSAPNVLMASPRLEVSSVAQLIDTARARPLSYASAGAGQTIHVCTALFCQQAGIGMQHRPYDGGSATAYPDLAAGNVHVYFDSLLGCLEPIARGDAIPLAVSSLRRSSALPGVPTLIESGLPDHALDVWLGVFASGVEADLPGEHDERLAGDLSGLGLAGGTLDAGELAELVAGSGLRWMRAFEAAR